MFIPALDLIFTKQVVHAAARALPWCVGTSRSGVGHLELSAWLGAECSHSKCLSKFGIVPTQMLYVPYEASRIIPKPVGVVPCGNPEGLDCVPAQGTRRLPPDPRENLRLPVSRGAMRFQELSLACQGNFPRNPLPHLLFYRSRMNVWVCESAGDVTIVTNGINTAALIREIQHCRSQKEIGEKELSGCAAWPKARVIGGGERGGRWVQVHISGGLKSLLHFD